MTKQQMLSQLSNVFFKQKCTTIKLQEESEVTYHIPSWISILIISFTLVKNMTFSFNSIVTTQIHEIFPREESQPMFANRSMIDYSSCCSYAKRIRVSKVLELYSTFGIQGF